MRGSEGASGNEAPAAVDRNSAGKCESDEVQYQLRGMPHLPEDIVFCVDKDRQVEVEMKVAGSKGQPLTRIDALKQALLLFVHSKLAMFSQHRFAFATMGQTAAWHHRELTNDIDVVNAAVRSLPTDGLYPRCDLYSLFRMVAPDAKQSRASGRSFRVIFIYCRSDVVPELTSQSFSNQQLFTFDALYLHDKPGRENCPQKVYDALVDVLERVTMHEGYIYESGSGLARLLFKQTCLLLSHPQQRCMQEDLSAPKDLAKPISTSETSTNSITSRNEDNQGSHSSA
ncbi:hypothetical protein O6H91_15G055000 [Diphasiastrum complanatum]|uniref:Uncharacterized protein n=1 Tax=Diphasiastrum complanatum TaxID=34168 RepID=A0ACC2BIB2_DIPCM|nr:hypothetical protein O6H91_15G055000 [Diphasiastrum complanatum]